MVESHPPVAFKTHGTEGEVEFFLKLIQNRRLWQLILAAMIVPLALIAFWPSPVDQPIQGQLAIVLDYLHQHGVPAWFNYRFVEAAANVVLFIPLGIVSSLSFPRTPWWLIGGQELFISCCMETGQLLLLNNRFASTWDVVTNTSGAVIGALIGAIIIIKVVPRDSEGQA